MELKEKKKEIITKANNLCLPEEAHKRIEKYIQNVWKIEKRAADTHKGLRKYLIAQAFEELYKAEEILRKYE